MARRSRLERLQWMDDARRRGLRGSRGAESRLARAMPSHRGPRRSRHPGVVNAAIAYVCLAVATGPVIRSFGPMPTLGAAVQFDDAKSESLVFAGRGRYLVTDRGVAVLDPEVRRVRPIREGVRKRTPRVKATSRPRTT